MHIACAAAALTQITQPHLRYRCMCVSATVQNKTTCVSMGCMQRFVLMCQGVHSHTTGWEGRETSDANAR